MELVAFMSQWAGMMQAGGESKELLTRDRSTFSTRSQSMIHISSALATCTKPLGYRANHIRHLCPWLLEYLTRYKVVANCGIATHKPNHILVCRYRIKGPTGFWQMGIEKFRTAQCSFKKKKAYEIGIEISKIPYCTADLQRHNVLGIEHLSGDRLACIGSKAPLEWDLSLDT
jgi:hypothetical protein